MIDCALGIVAGLMLVLAVWDAGYFYRGRHRGVYVEKPRWAWSPAYSVVLNGLITPNEGREVAALPPGAFWVPIWEDDHGAVGRCGDSCFDRTDPVPIRLDVEAGAS